jgi:hypothetical protein
MTETKTEKWKKRKICSKWTFWTLPLPYNGSQVDHDVCKTFVKSSGRQKQQKLLWSSVTHKTKRNGEKFTRVRIKAPSFTVKTKV